MYKMIAIDIDDTLLNDQLVISEPTKAALFAAQQQGVAITLATGRMFASAKQIAAQLQLNVPLITYQGSYVKNLLDDQLLYAQYVPKEAVNFICHYAEEHQLHLHLYIDDQLYAKEENEKLKEYVQIANVPYRLEPNYRNLVDQPVTKLLIYEEPTLLDQVSKEINQVLGSHIHITKSKPFFLEFLHLEGTKGHAVHYLAQRFGCQMEEVIAIGDSWNDHEMLERAGLGVAMGNAIDSLKEIADYITLSNNDDGVKHVIDRFILHPERTDR